ncbi:MAG: amidohydrolase family protein [Bacteroidales bacterium]|nr:amidohydrolase family protein [Bacteroidales bacterium]
MLVLTGSAIISCKNNYYSQADFSNVPKVDAHFHLYTGETGTLEMANKNNFRLLGINTYSGDCEHVADVHQWSKNARENYPDNFEFIATFCLEGWGGPGWTDNTLAWLEQCISDGAVAVKVWKNIGMEFRDNESNLIMIDDPGFDEIFFYLANKGIPLTAHLGEPKNCWLPAEEMTVKNDSSYFTRNPQYHMFLHPEFPSYEEQMAARDRMLQKNPDLAFIGCHLASLEWSVDELAGFLDRFPNASVDMAARMGQLFYQTAENRDKVRNFFIKYQDRILYGTDVTDRGGESESFRQGVLLTWQRDWEFLVTDNKMQSNLINDGFRGLKLPKEIIDKIYYHNAKKWYKIN